MISLAEVMKAADSNFSPHTVFYAEECRAYYNVLSEKPAGGVVCEVGVQFGRSSAVALSVAKSIGLEYHAFDCFLYPRESKQIWTDQANGIMGDTPYGVHIINSFSQDAMAIVDDALKGKPVDVMLIDADHSTAGVIADCNLFVHRIPVGGHLLVHDWENPCFPEVAPACTEYLKQHGGRWILLGVDMSLAVWKRLE